MPTYDYGAIGSALGEALFPDQGQMYQAQLLRQKAASAAQEAQVAAQNQASVSAVAPVIARRLSEFGYSPEEANTLASGFLASGKFNDFAQGVNNLQGGQAVLGGTGDALLRGVTQQKLADDALKTGLIAPPGGTAGFQGQSVEAQHLENLRRLAIKLANGGQLTQDEGISGQMSMQALYGRKYTVENGREIITQPDIPAPLQGLVQLWSSQPALAGAPGAAPPAAGAPQAAGGAPSQSGGPGVTVGRQVGASKIPEGAARTGIMASSFGSGVQELNRMVGYDAQTGALGRGFRPSFMGEVTSEVANSSPENPGIWDAVRSAGAYQMTDQKQVDFNAAAFWVTDSMLRFRSGAATPNPEVKRYYNSMLPRQGDNDATIANKMFRLNQEAARFAATAQQVGYNLDQWAQLSPEEQNRLANEINSRVPMLPTEQGVPGQAPAAPSGTTSTGIPWSVE